MKPGDFVGFSYIVSDMTPRGKVPWFQGILQILPSGFINESETAVALEVGPFFVKCICKVGVVFFRIENVKPLKEP